MSAQPPLIRRGGLTGRVYLVTRYEVAEDGSLIAKAKTDITAEYEAQRLDDGLSRRRLVRADKGSDRA